MENQETKRGTINIAQPRNFKIDFTKVTTLDDVIDIIKAMDLTVTQYNETIPEQFKPMFDKGLLIETTK